MRVTRHTLLALVVAAGCACLAAGGRGRDEPPPAAEPAAGPDAAAAAPKLPYIPKAALEARPRCWVVVGYAHPSNLSGAGFLFPGPDPGEPWAGRAEAAESHRRRFAAAAVFFGSGAQLERVCTRLKVAISDLASLPADDPFLVGSPGLKSYVFPLDDTKWVNQLPEDYELRQFVPKSYKLLIMRPLVSGFAQGGVVVSTAALPPDGAVAGMMYFRDWDEARVLLGPLLAQREPRLHIPTAEECANRYRQRSGGVLTAIPPEEVPPDFRRFLEWPSSPAPTP